MKAPVILFNHSLDSGRFAASAAHSGPWHFGIVPPISGHYRPLLQPMGPAPSEKLLIRHALAEILVKRTLSKNSDSVAKNHGLVHVGRRRHLEDTLEVLMPVARLGASDMHSLLTPHPSDLRSALTSGYGGRSWAALPVSVAIDVAR